MAEVDLIPMSLWEVLNEVGDLLRNKKRGDHEFVKGKLEILLPHKGYGEKYEIEKSLWRPPPGKMKEEHWKWSA